MAKSRPHVILSAAMSLDGKIATRSGKSNLSSRKDLIRVHKLRANVDAILVGKGTVMIDDPSLMVKYVRGKNPIRIILDPNGLIKLNSKIVKTSSIVPTIIVVSEEISAKKISRLQKYGLEVLKCGRSKIDLKKLLQILYNKGVKKLLVEGGGTTNWYFFKAHLFDEIIITITPYILGGKNSISLVNGEGFDEIPAATSLRLKKTHRMKNELVLHYII